MKRNVFVLLLLMFSVVALAQNQTGNLRDNFKKIDSATVVKTIEKVIQLSGKDYKLEDVTSRGNETYYEYKAPENRTMVFSVYSFKEGANPSLEIKGKKVFSFKKIVGRFLDVFPFWNKEIKPDSVKEEVAKKQRDFYPNDRKRDLIFQEIYNSDGYWYISF
ncbi:hypothetical protein [Ornithobacterium rhinotracheale]|uniref:hypothetical protein n=1 Tax=Ornithobacterium rhinotracheale TaxID=28251 RepID=UPI001FF16565|nr:hypothetical protein [Ornithobacterium rhinotracheale]MCK0206202.1 hypothetical protein [Ornithobacterium rhinotracheale]